MSLSENDIKSELSYASLHAIAARAGCECQVSQRHSDNRGIARLYRRGPEICARPPNTGGVRRNLVRGSIASPERSFLLFPCRGRTLQ